MTAFYNFIRRHTTFYATSIELYQKRSTLIQKVKLPQKYNILRQLLFIDLWNDDRVYQPSF